MSVLEEGGEFQVMGDDPRVLIDYLAKTLQISNSLAKRLIDDKRIFVNERRAVMTKASLKNGDLIEITKAPATWEAVKAVLYQDKHCIVINKPAQVNAAGDASVEKWLKASFKSDALAAVHRLDKDTTGCLMFARHKQAQEELEDLFRERKIKKAYLALVHGQCQFNEKVIDAQLDGKDAKSIAYVLDSNRKSTLVRVVIETGRTHQIRRHMSGIGSPLIGDAEYGVKKVEDEIMRKAPRLMLHASTLSFHPSWSGKPIDIEAPLAQDIIETARALGLRTP